MFLLDEFEQENRFPNPGKAKDNIPVSNENDKTRGQLRAKKDFLEQTFLTDEQVSDALMTHTELTKLRQQAAAAKRFFPGEYKIHPDWKRFMKVLGTDEQGLEQRVARERKKTLIQDYDKIQEQQRTTQTEKDNSV
ncbi:MAG: hypothetical protein SGARI_004982 [Bacillariaceae sp.]